MSGCQEGKLLWSSEMTCCCWMPRVWLLGNELIKNVRCLKLRWNDMLAGTVPSPKTCPEHIYLKLSFETPEHSSRPPHERLPWKEERQQLETAFVSDLWMDATAFYKGCSSSVLLSGWEFEKDLGKVFSWPLWGSDEDEGLGKGKLLILAHKPVSQFLYTAKILVSLTYCASKVV